MLWSARQIVINPCDEGRIHLHVLQFGLQQPVLDAVEGAGEAKEHDMDQGVGSIHGGEKASCYGLYRSEPKSTTLNHRLQ